MPCMCLVWNVTCLVWNVTCLVWNVTCVDSCYQTFIQICYQLRLSVFTIENHKKEKLLSVWQLFFSPVAVHTTTHYICVAAVLLTSGSAHHHTLYLCGSSSCHKWQCTPPHTISVWQLFFSPVAVHTTKHYICVAAFLLTSGSAHHHTLYLCGSSSSHQWQCTPPHTISVWQLFFSPVAVQTTTHYICVAALLLTSGSAHHHTLYLCGSFSSHQWQCTPPHTISVWQLFFSPVAVQTTTHYICVAALLLTSGSAHHHTLYLCGSSSSHQWQCTPPHTISVWQLFFSPVAVHTTTHYICVADLLLTSGSAHHHTLYLCGSFCSHQWQCTPPHTISVWQLFFSPVEVHTITHYICVAALLLTSGSAHHHTLYLCGSSSSHKWQCTPPHTISVWQIFFSPVAVHTTTH